MSRAILILAALLASGCAGPGSLVGRPEADLRANLGAPTAEYVNRDGSRTLAYRQGAFGTQTYMAEVSPSGSIGAVRQAMGEETFVRIVPGMTGDEVLRLIGPPGDSMDFPRQREVSWEYRFVDTWGYPSLFFVNLDRRGVVVSKFTRRIDRIDRH
jgi:hypothetical protein